MTSRPTHNPLGNIPRAPRGARGSGRARRRTAVPAKADGITLTVQPPGSSMQPASKSCYASYDLGRKYPVGEVLPRALRLYPAARIRT